LECSFFIIRLASDIARMNSMKNLSVYLLVNHPGFRRRRRSLEQREPTELGDIPRKNDQKKVRRLFRDPGTASLEPFSPSPVISGKSDR